MTTLAMSRAAFVAPRTFEHTHEFDFTVRRRPVGLIMETVDGNLKYNRGPERAPLLLHTNALERYQKLKKLYTNLMERNFNRDDLDDFIQTANSLPEWIHRDPAMTEEQKDAVNRFTIDNGIDWQLCRQIANAQKHATAKPGRGLPSSAPVVKSVQINEPGRGILEPQSGRIFGSGDEIAIHYDDTRTSAIGFVVRTFGQYRFIFETVPVPPDQRVLPTPTQFLRGA